MKNIIFMQNIDTNRKQDKKGRGVYRDEGNISAGDTSSSMNLWIRNSTIFIKRCVSS
jgi:hypothetical protein